MSPVNFLSDGVGEILGDFELVAFAMRAIALRFMPGIQSSFVNLFKIARPFFILSGVANSGLRKIFAWWYIDSISKWFFLCMSAKKASCVVSFDIGRLYNSASL